MAVLFDARPLSVVQGIQILAVGIVLLFVVEIEKWLYGPVSERYARRSD